MEAKPELKESEPKLLEKGLQEVAVAHNTVYPKELKKMVAYADKLETQKEN